jgi:hypothetical protein
MENTNSAQKTHKQTDDTPVRCEPNSNAGTEEAEKKRKKDKSEREKEREREKNGISQTFDPPPHVSGRIRPKANAQPDWRGQEIRDAGKRKEKYGRLCL